MPVEPASTSSGKVPERRGLFVLYLLLALGVLSAGYVFRGELAGLLSRLEGVVTLLGPAAPVAMAVVCGLWGALCLPGPLMQGTVGTLFATKPLVALGVVVAGETIAQIIAFTIGRTLGRQRVRERLQGQPWFAKLETETEKKGLYGVFVFRLMPFFPNALGSYAFGLTSLRFWPYLIASVVGSFPKMVLYIYGTTSLVRLLKAGALSSRVLVMAVLLLLVLALLGRALQKRLRRRAHL